MIIIIKVLPSWGFTLNWGARTIVDIENAYIASLPREYLVGASWTLSKFSLDISNQFKDEIIKHNPNWTFGQPFDTSILDAFNPIDPMKNHLDVTE